MYLRTVLILVRRSNVGLNNSGPWSLDWLQQVSKGSDEVVGSDSTGKQIIPNPVQPIVGKKKKYGGRFKHSAHMLKKVARMSVKDRHEILKFLQKHSKLRKGRSTSSKVLNQSNFSNNFSTSSSSSVNKDWEHWVALHGKSNVANADVTGIGTSIGVKFSGDKNNRFNVLSKEGRRELRATVERVVSREEEGVSGGGEAGC